MWSKWWCFDFLWKMALTILMKLGQNVEEIDPENLAKTACQNFHRFQRYSTAKGRLGGPSMDRTRKILDPKFFFIFGILVLQFVKKNSKLENRKFFPFMRFIQVWHLKSKFFEKVSKWSNLQSYHVKSEIWRHSKNFPLLGHQSWRLRKICLTSWTSLTSLTSWTC